MNGALRVLGFTFHYELIITILKKMWGVNEDWFTFHYELIITITSSIQVWLASEFTFHYELIITRLEIIKSLK